MRMPQAARQAVLAAIVAAALGGLVLAGTLLQRLGVLQEQLDRATARTTGVVVEAEIGDDEDVRVRWTDAGGRSHTSRLGVYDDYDEGDRFAIRYDPADPDHAFPADPEETSAVDDLEVPVGIVVLLLLAVLGGWALRRWWWRRALKRPGEQLEVRVLRADRGATANSWLQVGNRYQQVMWDPALDSHRGRATVHRGRRRVAVVLPDGTALVPCGRLKQERYQHVLVEVGQLGGPLPEVLVLPSGATAPEPERWRRATAYAAGGAALGLVLSWVLGTSPVVAAGLVVGVAGLLVNTWAMAGGEP